MKDIVSLFAAILFMFSYSHAQSIAPQSINSGGASVSQSNGSLSFTVGELVVLSLTDSEGNTLGGGFTAGAALTTASIKKTDPAVLDVSIFPNPTSDLVNIRINFSTIDQFFVSITDLQGKEVYNGKYVGVSNLIGINTASFATGEYILTLKDKNNQVGIA
jgi:hypothetical protein